MTSRMFRAWCHVWKRFGHGSICLIEGWTDILLKRRQKFDFAVEEKQPRPYDSWDEVRVKPFKKVFKHGCLIRCFSQAFMFRP